VQTNLAIERTRKEVGVPDSFGFNHEPHHGRVFHRCIECDEYPWGVWISEKERERHHRKHQRERLRALEKARKANLRLARKAKRAYEKESA